MTGQFDEGSDYGTWRPNGTEDWLIFVTQAGRGRLGYGEGRALIVEPGDVALLAPGTPHDYATDPAARRWKFIWAHFVPRPHWLPWLNWPGMKEEPGLRHLRLDSSTHQHVTRAMRETDRWCRGMAEQREMFAMNALEQAMLWLDLANPRSHGRPLDQRIQRAMDHITDHLAEPMSLDQLARVANLSTSRLAHLFKEQVGLTPLQFVDRQRMERAKQLFELTDLPVQQVADRVGIENPFYFSSRFKRYTGQSPSVYRRKTDAPPPLTATANATTPHRRAGR